jgi:hypothetical protein
MYMYMYEAQDIRAAVGSPVYAERTGGIGVGGSYSAVVTPSGQIVGRRKTVGRKRVLERTIERAQEKLDQLEIMGEDDYEDGAVLTFKKRFTPGGIAYTYVALKIAGGWYLSGRQHGSVGRTWDSLVEFIVENNTHPEVWVVSEWERVI